MLSLRSFCLLLLAGLTLHAAEEKVSFNKDVRPILSTCFYCHGPDEKHREAKLRLDVRESAIAERDGVRAIVPGKPDESELLQRVVSEDKDDVMPPPKAKKPLLTKKEVAVLRRWIEQGAEYEGHWAFQPLREDTPPAVKNTSWARTPIDQFILARLESEGIAPSPEADRATLIRRVSLDLTGLLPSPEEIDAFARDTAPDAYEKVVERLLASPHYGERWGRHWLDEARYGDSNGYSGDSARVMWPYRDWVIAAHNADVPFDRFTIEQLAGDLLPGATKAQRVATGFHRNTLINEEGGVDNEQFRIEAAMDRTATTGTVWLGLSVGCAQCHTHKYDPITHREYYQLYAFFNSSTDVNNKAATVQVSLGEMLGKEVAAAPLAPDLARAQRQAAWEKTELARLTSEAEAATAAPVKWTQAGYLEYGTKSNASFRLLEDNSLLSDGRGTFNDTYRVVATTWVKRAAAVRLRVLTDESLPNNGPGLASNGNFVLTDFEVLADGKDQPFARAMADHEQPDYPVSAAIDNNPKSGWAINVAKGSKAQMNANHEAVFVFAKPLEAETVEVRLHHDLNENYLIGRFALDFAETAPPDPKASVLLAALRAEPDKRSDAKKKLVEQAFAQTEPKKKPANGDEANAATGEQMVMAELPQPRPTFLFQRGDFLRPDKELGPLQPGVIAAVSAAFKNPPAAFANRLDLARWLVSPENPLTPRVTVNRIWMHYFGRGLVETDDDFGAQGSMPTHPELLDWLGREFIRRGWSMKAMHRLIVTSATYRQASFARPDLAEKDPRNLLLARQERLRVEGEIVRDEALCASGLLDPALGGPSVRPPQPEGVFSFTQNKKTWETSPGTNRFRRGLYTMFYRSAPYPLLTTFDSPNFQVTCTRRPRSDTPLQSLTLANDPAFIEIAQGFAARLLRELPAASLDERLRRACRIAFGRDPEAVELTLLGKYTRHQMAVFFPGCRRGTRRRRPRAGEIFRTRRSRRPRSGRAHALQHRQLHHPRMNLHELESAALRQITRRHLFGQCAVGLGAIALNQLLSAESRAAINVDAAHPLAERAPQFAPKAKRVIYLFMGGGPSQLELFEDKPKLRELSGQKPPPEMMSGKRFAFLKGNEKLLGTKRSFGRYGDCGMELSELLPHHRKIVDDVCWMRGMTTDVFNHGPAKLFMNTGFQAPGRPALGSWATYGLGTVSRDLPGFVVMQSGARGPRGGSTLWSSGFLPTSFQGVPLRGQGDPILYLRSPEGFTPEQEKEFYETVAGLNQARLAATGDGEISTRVNAYETAFRMQTSAPELMDLSQETPETLELYGCKADVPLLRAKLPARPAPH